MSRHRTSHASSNGKASPLTPVLPVLPLDPNGVYLPRQVIAALGLRVSSLRHEWRQGRLRIIKRCNKNFLLGKDVLAWLDGGELRRRLDQNSHD
jgi:hypothetical protein